MSDADVLDEQRRYYVERAPEYEDWWFRRGRYVLEPEAQACWDADVAEAEAALAAFDPRGDVVELAAGTGLWTRRLASTASRLVAVDASAETLALNRSRIDARPVEFVVADLFDWQPAERFDVCFFSFWLTHVPATRFDDFWRLVRSLLRPDGRVFVVDSARYERAEHEGEREVRTLADGRAFSIVKRFWEPAELADRVRPLGFALDVRNSAHGHFLYGEGR